MILNSVSTEILIYDLSVISNSSVPFIFILQAMDSSKVEGDSQIQMGRFISFLQVKSVTQYYNFFFG